MPKGHNPVTLQRRWLERKNLRQAKTPVER